MKHLRIILLILLFIANSMHVYAARIHPCVGTTSAPFLKLGIGARAIAMGQSFVAVADDATAPEWNPAGSSSVLYKQVAAMHHIHFQDITQDFAGYIHPSNKITWGITARGLFYPDDLERRSGLGEGIPEEPLTQYTDKFGGNDISFAVNASKKFDNGIDGGINLRFIRQKIDAETGSTFAFDVGVLSEWNKIKWGAAIQNIGPGIKFIEKTYDLPLNLKAGLSCRPIADELTVAFDYNHSIDNYPYFSVGAEWNFFKAMILRGGYRYKAYGNDLGALSGVSAGMGFEFLEHSSIDYAFLPQGDLGNTHRISMNISFGGQLKVPVKEEKITEPEPKYKKAEISVDLKKIALRKQYSYIEAVPGQEMPLKKLMFYAEYPAGIPCPAKIEFAREPDSRNKQVYSRISIKRNFDLLIPSNMKILFSVEKKWLEENNLKPENIIVIDSNKEEIKSGPIKETQNEIIFQSEEGTFLTDLTISANLIK